MVNISIPFHTHLTIAHNEHLVCEQTLEKYLEGELYEDKKLNLKCIQADSIWEIRWYTITNYKFYHTYAPTWVEVMEVIEKYNKLKDDEDNDDQ